MDVLISILDNINEDTTNLIRRLSRSTALFLDETLLLKMTTKQTPITIIESSEFPCCVRINKSLLDKRSFKKFYLTLMKFIVS